jgi:hypothetical protein
MNQANEPVSSRVNPSITCGGTHPAACHAGERLLASDLTLKSFAGEVALTSRISCLSE